MTYSLEQLYRLGHAVAKSARLDAIAEDSVQPVPCVLVVLICSISIAVTGLAVKRVHPPHLRCSCRP